MLRKVLVDKDRKVGVGKITRRKFIFRQKRKERIMTMWKILRENCSFKKIIMRYSRYLGH